MEGVVGGWLVEGVGGGSWGMGCERLVGGGDWIGGKLGVGVEIGLGEGVGAQVFY